MNDLIALHIRQTADLLATHRVSRDGYGVCRGHGLRGECRTDSIRYCAVSRYCDMLRYRLTGETTMTRNPHTSTPRTMRDCTFQDWADPIERPAEPSHRSIGLYVWALVVAAVGTVVWRLA